MSEMIELEYEESAEERILAGALAVLPEIVREDLRSADYRATPIPIVRHWICNDLAIRTEPGVRVEIDGYGLHVSRCPIEHEVEERVKPWPMGELTPGVAINRLLKHEMELGLAEELRMAVRSGL